MEKGGLQLKRSKVVSYWGETHDPGIADTGHTEYLTRLTSLRDSLIDQEQVYLADAVERLRLHSLSNKNSSDRLRMNGIDAKKTTSRTPRTNMLTTVEKFRQMRPQQPKPVILPLEGKQMFDVLSQKRSSSDAVVSSSESSAYTSGPDGATGEVVTLAGPSEIHDTVQINLLRLTPRTSSMPNIGRKARQTQESLEPKTKPVLNLRSRASKQSSSHQANPFMPFHNARSLSSSFPSCTSYGGIQRDVVSQPHIEVSTPLRVTADARSRVANGKSEAKDNEIAEETRQKDLTSSTVPESHEGPAPCVEGRRCGRGSDRGYVCSHQDSSKIRLYNKHRMFHHQTTLKKLSGAPSNNVKTHHSYSNDYTGNQILNSANNVNNNSTEYNIGIIQLLPKQTSKALIKNIYTFSHEDGDVSDTRLLDDKEDRFPDIHNFQSSNQHSYRSSQSSRKTPQTTNGSGIDLNIHGARGIFLQNGQRLETETSKPERFNDISQFIETQEKIKKKLIVVDMPKIIFNAPSPAPECFYLDEKVEECPSKSQSQHTESQPQHTESQPQHTESQSQHTESQSQHTESQSQHTESQPQHTESQSQHTESQSQHTETQPQHTESQSQHTESQSQHTESQSQHTESQPQHTESQSQHTESQSQSNTFPSPLKKAVQHREIRRRELTNLLEDVKELSIKTEALKLQSTTEVAIQHNIM